MLTYSNDASTQFQALPDAVIFPGNTQENSEIVKVCNKYKIPILNHRKRNPMNTTTCGIGEAFVHALEHGFRKFIVGLGGSATNDGGLGMLQALGVVFNDVHGKEVSPYGSSLYDVVKVDISHLHQKLKDCHIFIASDVMNPLCDDKEQRVCLQKKGAKQEQLEMLDRAMEKYALLLEKNLRKHVKIKQVQEERADLGLHSCCWEADYNQVRNL